MFCSLDECYYSSLRLAVLGNMAMALHRKLMLTIYHFSGLMRRAKRERAVDFHRSNVVVS